MSTLKQLNKFNCLVIDFQAFIYKYSYAYINIKNDYDFPIGGIYGFFRMLTYSCKYNKIKKIFICLEGRKNFKKKIFTEYKANRPKLPDFIKKQINLIIEIFNFLPICIIHNSFLEGDDAIGLTCSILKQQKNINQIYINTTDKDLLQLLSDNIKIILFNKKVHYLENKIDVENKLGIFPKQIPDYLALVGDLVDNFKGAKGIGKKIGIKLLKKFNNLDNIYKNLNKILPKYAKILKKYKKDIELYKKITLIKDNYKEIKIDNKLLFKKKINKYLKNNNNIKNDFNFFLENNKTQLYPNLIEDITKINKILL